MKDNRYYAAIIGGGASGLICAVRAAQRYPDKRIAVIESADRIGKKLLVTGNGRCNLSNINASSEHYHGEGSGKLIDSLFSVYPPEAVIRYFGELGLMTRVDSEGRVYPRSNLASSVLDTLRLALRRYSVEELCDTKVSDVRRVKGGYDILTDSMKIYAEKVVIAVGGHADYAGRRSASEGLVSKLNVNTVEGVPALSPIRVRSDILRPLKGIRVNAEVSLMDGSRPIRKTRGELQFTETALSGICVFDLAREARLRKGCRLEVDLLPELSCEDAERELSRRIERLGDDAAESIFIGLFHKNIGAAILRRSGIKASRPCNEISDKELNIIINNTKHLSFEVDADSDFRNSQVTAGGIALWQLDPMTFELKKHPGLYAIGEALNVDGDCGGYNLQFAFASGMRAGDSL